MKINKIIFNSSSEVEGHFADIIFFQGCFMRCPFCFNKETWPVTNGDDIDAFEIIGSLSHFSDTVVLSGGEPLLQPVLRGLIEHLRRLTDKFIILETALFDDWIYKNVDKVLLSIKTCYNTPKTERVVDAYYNVDPIVVIGDPWFNPERFREIVRGIKKDIYIRYYNDNPADIIEARHILKDYKKPLKVFKQLIL